MCVLPEHPYVVWFTIPDSGDQDIVVLNNPMRHGDLVSRIVQLEDAATWSPVGSLRDPLEMWPNDEHNVVSSEMQVGDGTFVPNYLLVFLELSR